MRLPYQPLAIACPLCAAPLAAIAWGLPERLKPVAIATGLVALGHLATMVLALLRHPATGSLWRAQSAGAIALIAYVGWTVTSSSLYLAALHDGLGPRVLVALFIVALVLAALLLPLAWWGLVATADGSSGRRRWLGLFAIGSVMALRGAQLRHGARGVALSSDAERDAFAQALPDALSVARPAPERGTSTRLWSSAATVCAEEVIAPDRLTLFVTFLGRDKGHEPAELACLQAATTSELILALRRLLAERALAGPIRIDVVVRGGELARGLAIDDLALRPADDGVCSGRRCLMPWQLVGLDAFAHSRLPAPFDDVHFGFAKDELVRWLEPQRKGSLAANLTRIVTRSWLVTGEGDLADLANLPYPVNSATLADSLAQAEGYLLASQRRDGSFRERVDPHSGASSDDELTRDDQALAVAAVCSFAPSPQRDSVAKYALEALSKQDGLSAPALLALLRCRAFAGDRYDALAGELARDLVRQQAPDGGLSHDRALEALVLTLAVAADTEGSLPSRESLRIAVDRAMSDFARERRSRLFAPWFDAQASAHCLAARAALAHHRHDGYERACLDYVASARRFLFREGEVPSTLVGALGLTSLLPTPLRRTASFAEALASAIAILEARREPSLGMRADFLASLAFLRRHQLRADTCVACTPRLRIAGAFRHTTASRAVALGTTVQAWSAMSQAATVMASEP